MTEARPGEYRAQELRDALASDERTGELGLDVSFVGDRLIVRGTVGSEDRRAAILDVAREVGPGVEVVNETEVKEVRDPGAQESIG